MMRYSSAIIFALLIIPLMPLVASNKSDVNHYEKGLKLLARGDFGNALNELDQSVQRATRQGNQRRIVRSRLALSRALENLGEFTASKTNLQQALAVANALDDADLRVAVTTALGNVTIVTGPPAQAEALLREAIETASSDGARALALLDLGNHQAAIGQTSQALGAYRRAARLAGRAGNQQLAATALANAARLSLLEEGDSRHGLASKALDLALGLPDTHDKAFLLLNLGRSFARLDQPATPGRSRYRLRALHVYSQADKVARVIDDSRALSYALGYRAALYETEQRYPEMLELTEQALAQAKRLPQQDAHLLLGLWHWQAGRGLARISHRITAQNRLSQAIEAYRRAADQFSALRFAQRHAYGRQQSRFDTTLHPLYQQFLRLLFRAADESDSETRRSELLKQARDTVEALKAAELRDYFRDSCVDELQAKRRDIAQVSQSALIVYPVMLDDRLELLLHLPGGRLVRRTVAVGRDALTDTFNQWRWLLEEPSNRHRQPGAKIYRWLVAPYEDLLESQPVDTLVFVPDGAMRQVPMAAAWDAARRQYLIEKLPLAITPGVDLTDPSVVDRKHAHPLYAGLSKAVAGFPPLPFVAQEIQTVGAVFKGRALLDEAFTRKGLSASLKDRSINILHLATHAAFAADARKSFVMTYDGPKYLDQLARDISTFRFREQPLDLLVLSACETARGDARAALGLSGVAIKAGARSALGSLWKVDDQAAARLIAHFYRVLANPTTSRAEALREAQLALLHPARGRPSYRFPGYWSAFVLINSWL